MKNLIHTAYRKKETRELVSCPISFLSLNRTPCAKDRISEHSPLFSPFALLASTANLFPIIIRASFGMSIAASNARETSFFLPVHVHNDENIYASWSQEIISNFYVLSIATIPHRLIF